jgi:AcrR family transcriptional regulator
MSARAESTAATADRILDAALKRFMTTPFDRLRLDDIAADAGVTTQTVIRRFGAKAPLVVALVRRELGRVAEDRQRQTGVSAADVIDGLVRHYERYGSAILKVYAEASQVDGLSEVAEAGRTFHVGWCRTVFEPLLAPAEPAVRARRLAQVVAICDATTWRILREDGGLEPDEVITALREMLTPVLAPAEAASDVPVPGGGASSRPPESQANSSSVS